MSTQLAPVTNATAGGLEPAALHGIAGAWVEAVAHYTEAHPAGVLASFLAAAGNAIGREPHLQVGAARHGVKRVRRAGRAERHRAQG